MNDVTYLNSCVTIGNKKYCSFAWLARAVVDLICNLKPSGIPIVAEIKKSHLNSDYG